jgi:hypothetical protein
MRTSKKYLYFLIVSILIIFPYINVNYWIFKGDFSNEPYSVNVLANDTPDVDLSDLPDIPYDALNGLWYDQKVEMLIITPNGSEDFVNAVKPLAEWKNQKGVKTLILSNFSNYPGKDGPEKIRNMIKYYYEKENIRWVLLAGDADVNLVPIRYVYNPDVLRYGQGKKETIPVGSPDEYYKPTDFYYADLTGSWDNDGDGQYGEAPRDNSNGNDEIEWIPEIYVGRLPASTAEELEIMTNKTLTYEKNPELGDWMNQMLLAGGVSDTISTAPPDGEDEGRLTTYIWQNYIQSEINFTHLVNYETYIPPQPYETLNSTSFKTNFNLGYSTVLFAGHGSCSAFTDIDYPNIYLNTDASSSSNIDMPSLVYAAACTTSPYDSDGPDDNIGENLIKRENAGAIGYIGAMRVSWYFTDDDNLEELNRGNAKLFWEEFFQNKKFQQGKALYDSKVSYMVSEYYTEGIGSLDYDFERKQILTYCLLGDPEVDIYTDIPKNVSNPFTGNIYEGQLITLTIKDINGKTVPYARVYLRAADDKARTIYGDINGVLSFRLPAQGNENYNVTITGHNLIPSYFNFTTLLDNNKPEFLDEDYDPANPTVSDNLCFKLEVQDLQSGIENVYLLKSTDDQYEEYSYYKMSNSFEYDENTYMSTINKLDPGEYYFLVIARDWANNKKILDSAKFEIQISTPIMEYILITSIIMAAGIASISIFIGVKNKNNYLKILKRIG